LNSFPGLQQKRSNSYESFYPFVQKHPTGATWSLKALPLPIFGSCHFAKVSFHFVHAGFSPIHGSAVAPCPRPPGPTGQDAPLSAKREWGEWSRDIGLPVGLLHTSCLVFQRDWFDTETLFFMILGDFR